MLHMLQGNVGLGNYPLDTVRPSYIPLTFIFTARCSLYKTWSLLWTIQYRIAQVKFTVVKQRSDCVSAISKLPTDAVFYSAATAIVCCNVKFATALQGSLQGCSRNMTSSNYDHLRPSPFYLLFIWGSSWSMTGASCASCTCRSTLNTRRLENRFNATTLSIVEDSKPIIEVFVVN